LNRWNVITIGGDEHDDFKRVFPQELEDVGDDCSVYAFLDGAIHWGVAMRAGSNGLMAVRAYRRIARLPLNEGDVDTGESVEDV